MEEVAPTVARIKRMRLEGGKDPLPAVPAAEEEEAEESEEENEVPDSPPSKKTTRGKSQTVAKPAAAVKATSTAKQGKSKKKAGADDSGDELLDQYIQAGQEEEAKRQAEEERLRRQLNEGGIDFKEIRDGLDIQTIEIRRPGVTDLLEEEPRRWDPKWNGLKNFKKFRKQGEQRGRAQAKVIVPLVPAKGKDYGLGDEYWLTSREWVRKSTTKVAAAASETQSQDQDQSLRRGRAHAKGRTTGSSQFGVASQPIAIGSDSEEEQQQEEDTVDNSQLPDVADIDRPSRSRKGKAAERAGSQQSQAARRQQTLTRRTGAATATASAGTKRPAREAPAAEKAPKRRATRADKVRVENSDEEEDSEDGGLSFRFGKRK